MTKSQPEDVRFLVHVEDDPSIERDFFRVKAYPIRMEEGKVRNISSLGRYDHEALADLRIEAQGHLSEGRVYGWSVEYRDVFTVNAERAEVMAKTLRKVNRGLEKLEREQGYPANFAQYLARVAKILGIRTYGYNASPQPNGWSHDQQEYRWVDVNGIDYYIGSQINKLAEKAGVTA